jgi:hypothetical protein
MDAFAAKETINGMLRGPRLAPEQFLGKTTRSKYQSGICGAGVRRFARMMFRSRPTFLGKP